MEKKIVDCRGLACPQPVVNTKKAIDGFAGDEIQVIVDNETACSNVKNFASGLNWSAREISREGELFRITLKRGEGKTSQADASGSTAENDYLLYLPCEFIGRGDDDLGKILMRSFIKSLPETKGLPKLIVMLNSGVKLAAEGSQLIDDLKEFESRGVEIRSCGTCLDFFHLKEKLKVGRVTNMLEIILALQSFEKVVQP